MDGLDGEAGASEPSAPPGPARSTIVGEGTPGDCREGATMQEQTVPTPRARMRQRLQYLYGTERGDAAFAELARTLDRFPARRSTGEPDSGSTFTQADAVLISYGDTFLPDDPLPLSHGRERGSGSEGIPGSGREGCPLAALRAFA